jgi:hypothetical protein
MPSRSADLVGRHSKLLTRLGYNKQAFNIDTGWCSTDECCLLLVALLL